MNLLKLFYTNENGNIGTIFAITLLPLLFAIGVGVDMSRVSSYHKKLQDTSDTAALAAALALIKDGDEEMSLQGKEAFAIHAAATSEITYTEPVIQKTANNTVTVSTKGSFEPIFPQLFGYPKLDFDVFSETSVGVMQEGLEISIAFDSTASMNFDSRWDTSMAVMENTLQEMKSMSGRDNFYLTLVPFADRVNIGWSNERWLDSAAPSNWDGCVEPRENAEGGFDFAVDDASPTGLQSKFAPTDWDELGLWDTFRPRCSNVAITGPTNSVDTIINAANSLSAGGTGRFDVGLAWAWRTLSPNWRGQWNVSQYPSNNSENRKKKIIFVSDGNSESSAHEFSKERDWGWNQGSVNSFEHFTELCRKVKESDVEIYVMNIDGNPYAKPYFKECATSDNHYFLIDDASDMTLAFGAIRDELTASLRIVN